MKQFSLKKLLAVILSIILVMSVMPIAIFAAEDPSDSVNNGYAAAQLIVEDDSVALKLTLWWKYDEYDGDWTPNLTTLIPEAISTYNGNHTTEYTKNDINKIIVIGEPSAPSSMEKFLNYLKNNGYSNNLIELDLSESYFAKHSWGEEPIVVGQFAGYSSSSYFSNLKVLKLDTVKSTVIGYNSFNNMTSLEEIVLPKGLVNMENDALAGCTSLKSIAFPDTLTTFGVNVFNNCGAVKSWSFHGSDAGAAAIIAQMNDFTNYTSVDLSGSAVTASTALALKDTITYLNLSDCPNIDYSTADGKTLYKKILTLKSNGAEVLAPENPNYDPDEDNDTVTGDYADGRLIVDGDSVALDLSLKCWKCDQYDGEYTPNLTTFIPQIIEKYNENHGTEYTKTNINKVVVKGVAGDGASSLNAFIQYLRYNGYRKNLVEIDLSESNFISHTWNSTHILDNELFAGAYGDSYFPNLKVLKLDSVNVSAISYNAFNNMTSLETITLPNSITSIGPGAFENCSSLKAIDFPDTMVSLGDSAFYGCSALESWSYHGTGNCAAAILEQLNEFTNYKKVDLSNSGIDSAAASTIKSDVTYLNLKDCANIEYESAEGDALFKKILALEQSGAEVYYPENPNYDPYETLDRISGYGSNGRLIVKGEDVTLDLTIGWTFDAYVGEWTPELNTFIPQVVAKYNENHNTEYTVTDINKMKVTGSKDYQASMIEFIRYLRNNGYADRLVELDLSESYFVRYTWEPTADIFTTELFTSYNGGSYFPKLKVLKLDTVYGTKIGYNTFNNMTNLETITLPNNLENIENDAFKGCSALKSIDFPRYLKSMGVYVFYNCSSLESWSYHGSSMSSIDFFGENNLNATSYTKVDLSGSSVDSKTALKLRSSLTYLNLSNCPNIEYKSEEGVALWSKIIKLREGGAEVIAPDNLDFDYDEAMDTVKGGSEDGLWTDVASARVMMQDGAVTLKLHFTWEVQDYVGDWTPQFDKLIPLAFDTYNKNHSTNIAGEDLAKIVVTVSESGDIDLALPNFIKFFRDNGYAKNLEVLDLSEATFTRDTTEDWDTKELDNTLFAPYDGATYFPKLRVIKLGASQFTSICYNAFNNLTALEEIELPPNLMKIDAAAFKGCSALKSIDLPDSLNAIDRYAFEGCTALDSWSYHGSAEGADDVASFYNDLFVGFRDMQKVYTKVDLSGSTVNSDNVRRISKNATYVNLTDCPNVYIGIKGFAAFNLLEELRGKGAEVIAPELIYGDVDNDGFVQADDIIALKKVIFLGDSVLDSIGLNAPAGDPNGDGKFDVLDLVKCKNILCDTVA